MKKLSQMFYNLLLMAVIDGLLIYTELGTAHPFQGDTKKILLIAIGDLIWILLVLWGERLSDAWHTCRISTAADGILLILSAPVMIGAVQMITWLSGKRNKSVNYLGSLLKKVTSLSFMNLIGNLIVCYVILGILILLFENKDSFSCILLASDFAGIDQFLCNGIQRRSFFSVGYHRNWNCCRCCRRI